MNQCTARETKPQAESTVPRLLEQQTRPLRFGAGLKRADEVAGGHLHAVNLEAAAVGYDDHQGLNFDNWIEIESTGPIPFPVEGDSGVLVQRVEGRPGGSLFAGFRSEGDNDLGLTYTNPIAAAFSSLTARLV